MNTKSESRHLIYEGKAKSIFGTDKPDEVVMFFKDDATAGNKAKHDLITGKGAINCSITAKIYEKLDGFLQTHFIEKISNNEILVKKLDIIPLEVIIRNKVAGTFAKRYGLETGTSLQQTIIEFCLKDDDLNDPPICEDAVVALGMLDKITLSEIKEKSIFINEAIKRLMKNINLELVDMKIEFGLDEIGDIILADEICPDTMRLWENGKSFDKDLYRLNTGDLLTGYKEVDKRLYESL